MILFAATTKQNAQEQPGADRDGERLIRVGANGVVGALGPGDRASLGAGIQMRNAFLRCVETGAQGADRIGGVFREGIAHHFFGFEDQRLQIVEQFFGR